MVNCGGIIFCIHKHASAVFSVSLNGDQIFLQVVNILGNTTGKQQALCNFLLAANLYLLFLTNKISFSPGL